MRIDQIALGKLRLDKLSDDEQRLYEKCILQPENLYPSDVSRLHELFGSQGIEYQVESDLQKAGAKVVQSRYDQLLAGRDVRDLSDDEFEKATAILKGGAPGIARIG